MQWIFPCFSSLEQKTKSHFWTSHLSPQTTTIPRVNPPTPGTDHPVQGFIPDYKSLLERKCVYQVTLFSTTTGADAATWRPCWSPDGFITLARSASFLPDLGKMAQTSTKTFQPIISVITVSTARHSALSSGFSTNGNATHLKFTQPTRRGPNTKR